MLEKEISNLREYKALYFIEKEKLKKNNNRMKTANVISYVNFNDYSKVFLKTNFSKTEKILSLITENGYSAGTLMIENNQFVGYLNSNKKSNYAVFIGKQKAPGITHGSVLYDNNILVKYVPLWQKIKKGDEVVTSGMDGIFPKGIKVGVVVNVKRSSKTFDVLIRPYANTYNQNSFFVFLCA